MTDANGAKIETTEYVPYGEMREHTGAEVTNYKFTDQELDPETGLYNYGARLYDPVIGRFITPDTIIPDVYDPQTLNRYSYCRNNPLIYVDPNGHGWGNDKGTGPGDSPGHGNDSEGADPGPGDGDSDANGTGMPGGFGSISDPKATEPTGRKGITSDPKATEPSKRDHVKEAIDTENKMHLPPPTDFLRIHFRPPTKEEQEDLKSLQYDMMWGALVGLVTTKSVPGMFGGAVFGYIGHQVKDAKDGKCDYGPDSPNDYDDNTSNYDHEREGYPKDYDFTKEKDLKDLR